MGLPFVTSADLVSAYPAKSLEVADYVDDLIPLLAMTQNAQTGVTYTFVLADFTKLVTLNNGAAVAVTLPLEATVAWPTGTQLRLLNIGAGTVTVAGAVGVTINGTPLTLAQYKGANFIKTGTNTWVFIPFASGIGAAVYSDTPTGTYTGFAYKTFASGSNTLTVTTAGFADIVVCGGGGGGGNSGGGGAGGVLIATDVYLPVGTLTVIVGAGGAMATAGVTTRIDSFYGVGGGPCTLSQFGVGGGSGGGGGSLAGAGGTGVSGQGNAGGTSTGTPEAGSGGGGAGGAGVAGSGTGAGSVGGNGGAGTSTSIAGTAPTGAYSAGAYALGGGGAGGGRGTAGTGGSGGGGNGAAGTNTADGTDGSVNKSGGGGSTYASNTRGRQGGSGLVIVRVAV